MEFYARLEQVPHVSLTSRTGPIESIWAGEPPAACDVAFETTESILAGAAVPDFLADPGTEAYQAGWRMIPEIIADGPGSGIHGIERRGVRCIVQWEQPAYIDDDGAFVQSDTLSLIVQCRSRDRS